MKKFIAMLLALMLVLSLCACGQTAEPDAEEPGNETTEWAYDEYMTEEQWAELAAFYTDWSVVYEQVVSYADNEKVQASENGLAVIEKMKGYEETIVAILEDPTLIAQAGEDFDTFMGELNSLLELYKTTALPNLEALANS